MPKIISKWINLKSLESFSKFIYKIIASQFYKISTAIIGCINLSIKTQAIQFRQHFSINPNSCNEVFKKINFQFSINISYKYLL